QTDDVSLLIQALSIASSPDSRESVEELLSQAIRVSIRRNAKDVLTYALDHGAKVPARSGLVLDDPQIQTLDILVAHGWDINARHCGDQPFLWKAVLHGDGDLITWCLDHGSTTVPKDLGLDSDDEWRQDMNACPPLLEIAASQCTVATFELLRSRGAQLGYRALHKAASAAIDHGNGGEGRPDMLDKDRAKLHSERIAMVVHLVDTVGLAPNALDQPNGWVLGNHWGTPLCYVAHNNPNWDCSDVVTFLLRKGADPWRATEPDRSTGIPAHTAVDVAKRSNYQQFLSIVDEWK
ncbi:hypothetical protein K432DRAFT_247397, partial [Lepidopterella palustris CBS 459.81]